MAKPRTSLSKPALIAPATLGDRWRGFLYSRAAIILSWIVLWIPISLLFPRHIHLPFGAEVMPILGPFFVFQEGALSSTAVKYCYFPAAVFWGGLLIALQVRRNLLKNRAQSD